MQIKKNPRQIKLESELSRILEVLRTRYNPLEMILFGSLATGRIEESSDIDLVIIKDTKKRFIDRIGEVIELCKPRVAADFIIYTPREFDELKKKEMFIRKEIIERGKIVYERQ